jgi:hypothetical protein
MERNNIDGSLVSLLPSIYSDPCSSGSFVRWSDKFSDVAKTEESGATSLLKGNLSGKAEYFYFDHKGLSAYQKHAYQDWLTSLKKQFETEDSQENAYTINGSMQLKPESGELACKFRKAILVLQRKVD